ncbi:hypothetical protein [Aureibacillus halotolerans]|uniref:Uncharacterized protein n=1 Tax=Aureibacillus halotolerans TaxID=1508390 RepID=A0A4R6UCQ3_9BACI|nr:hypothetical protein [Aureibacillus halotolerans]TDQ42903.1 hypothetical protein EV213_101333 [Aureibacillus halotolerans]
MMNWSKGWLDQEILGHPVQFYWEFNEQDFILKVRLFQDNQLAKTDLKQLRTDISSLCDGVTDSKGKPTRHTYGLYNSLYKWSFDFKECEFKDIMNNVQSITDTIHPLLEQYGTESREND